MDAVTLNSHMFRAYDIRGHVGDDLTPAVADRIGQGYGTHLIRRYGVREVVVGRDNRPSSEGLRDGLVAGLRAAGLSVIDIGLSPSPLLYFAAAAWGVDGGANVTGSHNPATMNGMKLLERQGIPLSADEIQEVRRLAESGNFEHGAGVLSTRDPKEEYWTLLTRRFALPRPLKVVADAGNGVAAVTGPEALRRIGCEVIGLYTELDGTFPHHLPDPQEPATMTTLAAEVRRQGADFGVAWDGDADRLGVVDERGRRYEADAILAVLARDVLARHPGDRILVDVKMSLTAIEDIRAHGGEPLFVPTGHSIIKRRMRELGVRFGGEGASHFFFGEDYYGFDDAVFGACMLARILAGGSQPFSAYFSGLRRFVTSPEIKVSCPDAAKFRVAADIAERFRRDYPVLEVDGARIDFGDGWALVRASNTTPVLTLRLEAQSRDRYDAIRSLIWAALAAYPEVSLPEQAVEPLP